MKIEFVGCHYFYILIYFLTLIFYINNMAKNISIKINNKEKLIQLSA